MSLLQLYPDPNLRPELRGAVVEKIDFVAVPGINSSDASIERNALDTFTTSADSGRRINWLQDQECLPHVVPHSRVLIYCYNAFDSFNSLSWRTLLGLSENFLNLIVDSRRDDPHRPIIFIAHSLGGIVIKQALYLASGNPKFASIKDATQGIIFFGTPHRGTRPESSLESIITTVLQRLFFRKRFWKRYGEKLNLRRDPLPLRSSLYYNTSHNASDASFPSTLSIVSFYESIGLVVPKWNATLGLPGEVVTSLHAPHRDLCRYESAQDPNYKIVEDALLSLVEKALLSNPDRKDLNYSDAQLLHRLSLPIHSVPRYRISKNLPGTSEWLLSHPVFSRWRSSREKNIVLIVGIPGSGKSTLARFVADTLQNSSICAYKCDLDSSEVQSDALEVRTPRVLSFFCSYVNPPSNAVAVLRSLLHQLLTAQPSLLRYISPDDKLRCGQQTAQASLLGGLLAQVAEYVDIIVVIDALDELDDPVRDDLLDALAPAPKLSGLLNISPLGGNEVSESQVHSYPPHLSFKIFCTSRLEGYLGLPMDPSAYTINLSQDEAAEGIDYDIRLYIKSKLDQYTRQTLLRDSQKKAIEKRLVEKAEGMFLWVKLQLKTLFVLQPESHDIFSVLAHLPRGLENSYSRELEAIQRQPPDFADVGLRTLKWLLYAKRPLYVSELSEAIVFKTHSQLPRPLSQRHPHIGSTLDSLCGGLIVIDRFDSTVRLIHKSAKDFLLGYFHPKVSSPNDEVGWAQRSLAQACLSYLVFQDFEDLEVRCVKGNNSPKRNLNEWPTAPAELFREFPFLEYASIFWFKHLGSISVKHDGLSSSELGGLMHILSNPKSAPFRIWFPIYWLSHCTETWERRRYPEYPTELIVLAFLGNEIEIRYLLRWKKVAVDECTPAGEEWTPLMAAVWMGNESVVDLLLEYHAGDNAEPQQNARTLVQAIERGHITIAQKLIGCFTKIQSSLPSQRSILDISIGEEGVTPLIASVRGGSRELVTTCLSLGADVNARGFHPYPRLPALGILLLEIEPALPVTPLGAAISTGSIEISRDLLRSGADIISSNAIFIAAASNDGSLKLLFDNGADVDTKYDQNADGWTPLHYAALYGNRDTVERLLSRGVEVNSMDKFGWTPLQLACDSGKLEVAKTLLEKSTQSSISKNQALLYACSLADYELVKLLLGAGASPRATGRHNGKSTLDYLLGAYDVVHPAPRNFVASKLPHQGSRVAVLELLLRQGADLGYRDTFGNTYLQLAACRRWPKVVDALLRSSKIDIDHQNDRGETAIDIVARFGDRDLCQTFIHHGATVWRATFQNFLDSGSQAGVQCLIEEVKGPKRPRPKPSMKPYSLDTHQPLTSHSLPKHQNLVDPTEFSGGKLKKAARFFALRNIDNLEKVKLTTENNFSFGNTVKSWIEDHSGTPWIWWPLAPRLHPLKPGEVWLEWLCRGGTTHREKVSSELAQDIERLLDFQRELPDINTSENGRETSQAYSKKSDPAVRKSQHSHQKPTLDSLFEEIESAGADGHGFVTSPAGQQSAPRTTPYYSQTYRMNPLSLNPGSQGSQQSTRPPPSNPTTQLPRLVNVLPLVPPVPAPNVGSKYVLFKVGKNPITHIDAGIHNRDLLFFDELKRVYRHERGWLRRWFSIWRYHHCNFDKYIRLRDNLVSAQSTGTRTSNFLPIPPNDIYYEFVRGTCTHGEAPISQLEFRNMYRACSRLCCWWFRLTHQCNAPTNLYNPASSSHQPTDASLQRIPKRRQKWDMFKNYRGEAWGLTAFERPCFIHFLVYFFLSTIGPAVFWGLWLSIWKHAADLQNAAVPAVVVLTLWALLWQCAGGKWNEDREFE